MRNAYAKYQQPAHTVKEVFEFYNDIVKVLYAEVQAIGNQLPVELLFEIHAAFDHLKRYYVNGEDESESASKAYSHLKRGLLDAFKLILKKFNDNYKRINSINGLDLVDNGQFIVDLIAVKMEIINAATKARYEESNMDKTTAFEHWLTVFDLIKSAESKFFDLRKMEWAKREHKRQRKTYSIFAILISIIGSMIGTLVLEQAFKISALWSKLLALLNQPPPV